MRRSLMLTVMIAALCGAGSAECATDGLKGISAKMATVKKSLDETFIVEAHSPFVIAGNMPRSRFDSCVKYTILGSYRAFYRDFFDKKPDKIITIYLFKENLTYRKWASKLFGDTDPLRVDEPAKAEVDLEFYRTRAGVARYWRYVRRRRKPRTGAK